MRLLITIFFLLPVLLSAQNVSLIEDGKVWSMATYPFNEQEPQTYTGYNCEIIGDTLINDQHYNLVYCGQKWYIETYNGGGGGANSDAPLNLVGCIREDTITKKVYYINWFGADNLRCWRFDLPINEEMVLYDFGIEVGDTMHYNFDTMSRYILESKENHTFENGEESILYNFKGGIQWIEGIGGYQYDFGLLGPFRYFNFEGGCKLNCVRLDSTYYIGGSFSECDSITDFPVSVEELEWVDNDIDVKIYPIPASNKLTISIDTESTFNYQFYDLNGKALGDERKSISNKAVEDVSTLNKGVYILKVILENGKLTSHKFIKS